MRGAGKLLPSLERQADSLKEWAGSSGTGQEEWEASRLRDCPPVTCHPEGQQEKG